MSKISRQPGQLRPAPENFLSDEEIKAVGKGRRDFLRKSFLAASAALAAPLAAKAQLTGDDPAIVELPTWSTSVGQPVAARPYGQPSQYESQLKRREMRGLSKLGSTSASFCPLQGLFGIITPSGLHYERHHKGWHDINPAQHRLMVNAADSTLLKKSKVYTMGDLMRLPPVSRIHFIECGGNTGMEWGNPLVPTVQYTHGLLSCSEFTGVPLRTLLEDCGVDYKRARYVLAEGADGASLTRTIPMEQIESGEVFVAYGQNGEMLRPENGYPLRLVVPGAQGVSWVKWLRRIEVGDKPYASRDEAIQYMDLMPDGQLRQYTTINECKSVITTPSGGQKLLSKGFFNITGLAWSGRGKIKQVDISVDGGRNWRPARLDGLVLSKALTRFNFDWVWDGKPALLQSRAIDESGHVQPSYRQLREVRGNRSIYHNNAIQTWQVLANGEVNNVQLS